MQVRSLPGRVIRNGAFASRLLSAKPPDIEAAGRRDAVRRWRAAAAAILARAQFVLQETLEGHEGPVVSAAFAPDGRRIVTASRDGTARIRDADTGRPVATLDGHGDTVFDAAFAPDGRRIVTASEYTAHIWQDGTPPQ